MNNNDDTSKPAEKAAAVGSSKMLIKIALTALFAALTAAGAFIAIPVGPIPIVLQNIFAVLSGVILGPVLGGAAVGLYLLAGILGLPVFAGGTGGIARFAGPTGGYLIGYLLSAIAAGLIAGRPNANTRSSLLRISIAVIAGLLIVYVPGTAWLKIRLNLSWLGALGMGFFPFVVGDILKGIAAVAIAPRLRRIAAEFLDGKN
ncbi:MAG: biotin transporter BioY [Treponema sp.]|nr:biotin transporter BioY [Treponema sp.]